MSFPTSPLHRESQGGSVRSKVLIVDDESSLTDSLSEVLTDYGYEVVCAHNGKAALELYRDALSKEPFHLILLDIVMPALSGIEVLKTIRSEEKKAATPDAARVRIVMLSALKDSWQSDAMNEGCDGYVTKPFSIDFLVKTIEEHLKAA